MEFKYIAGEPGEKKERVRKVYFYTENDEHGNVYLCAETDSKTWRVLAILSNGYLAIYELSKDLAKYLGLAISSENKIAIDK